jgi:ATP-dependent exoDNAse (exonuclease V) beta subunit
MSILVFTPEDHKYRSLDVTDRTDWLSVTSFIGNFKKPFDADAIAEKTAKSKKSKWYGMAPEDIKAAWKAEALRATTLGTWYHNCREADICELTDMERHGKTIPVFKPIEKDGCKYSPSQKLTDGVYPEHLVYLKSAGLCGQSDLVEVINGEVHITDYKTNKEIKTESFTNWEGVSQKMASPLSHLDDCNLMHYALQLSMYMFIILKHNPKLKPGTLTLHHILFEESGRDKYDNPITALDSNGDPIVRDVVPYDVPYLKSEAISLIHWLEDNRSKLKPKY